MGRLYEILYKINKKLYYQLRYFYIRHRFIKFKDPQNLSEYLLAEMLRPSFLKYAQYADKIKVRDYVVQKGLTETLPKLYGIWDNANKVDFSVLPNKFALKTNHGCGNHIICKDKQSLNIDNVIFLLNKTLSQKYNITEPHYKFIEPLVFAEELIDDGKGELPIDYKFMCVNGVPKCILVCSERGKNTNKTTYSLDWKRLPWTVGDYKTVDYTCPKHLNQMIEMAKVLSKDFPFVRVDLYDCQDKIVFGELTFSPAEGLLSTFTLDALEQMNPNTKY